MRFRLVVLFVIAGSAWALTATAFSDGPPPDTVKNNDGCTCHGSANDATVIHDVDGWPSSYVPGQQYVLEVSSTNDIQPTPALTQNQGGFLAWVSHGSLATTPGTQSWIDVGTMSSGESYARHTKQGETENGEQRWSFTWTAPEAGAETVTLHVYVNRINSNGANSGDHWNKREFTSSEGSGTPTSVFPTPSHTNTPDTDPTTTSPSSPAETPPADQPGLGLVFVFVVLVVSAVLARRFR